ncbi:cardiolipin synthase [Lactococcus paracarnosus]|uniref:Cardiolipin synthase n=1 Tax=Pseudolactococcus paracarnosus TaxID=2749962 RepID=A0A7L4WFP0_9LACT|nr:cardiolipin synthase [Lactococcus paracarnosus]SPC35505.1 Cardiolipin synthase [Lactococcus piscium]MCJ1983133.1 cardiolipin synthase [Lactococcus paracarnosus]MCJ1993948.1 cardiolipin synthase [Lactococcus paracarnosus]MCJ1997230.1 cardiolipin synthase [Lactococcus paracarnosus]
MMSILETILTFIRTHFSTVIFLINIMLSLVIIFRERKSTSSTWSWLFVVNVLPIFGFILYILIGRGISDYRIFELKSQLKHGFKQEIERAKKAYAEDKFLTKITDNHVIGQLLHMLFISEESLVSMNTGVNLFTDGREKFDSLIADIAKATHHIHVEYYIFRMDKIGKEVTAALIEARKRGIEVRVLIDAWGSNGTKHRHFNDLIAAGGEVVYFFPLILPLINPRTNYRLHRKIVVIDGQIGYTGGFNIGDEYVSTTKKFGYWRDNHLRVTGDVVYSLQNRFIMDWNSQHQYEITESLPYFPETKASGNLTAQFVTSGPDSKREQIKMTYLKMINGAEDEIIIQTPYYIPDDAIHEALKLALLSGVKVKLLIPNKPDHPFVYWATYYYSGSLVGYGAEVYTYEMGFVHAKTIIVDGSFASVGSANFDYRSFMLDFEGNMVIYDRDFAQQLRKNFLDDVKVSQQLTLERYAQRSAVIKFKEGIARLIGPML